jgi:hypothetical protein
MHKNVDFVDQIARKLTYEHLLFQKLFRRLYPRRPLTGLGKREGRNSGETEEGNEGCKKTRRGGDGIKKKRGNKKEWRIGEKKPPDFPNTPSLILLKNKPV